MNDPTRCGSVEAPHRLAFMVADSSEFGREEGLRDHSRNLAATKHRIAYGPQW